MLILLTQSIEATNPAQLIVPIGAIDTGRSTTVAFAPMATLVVDVEVEKTSSEVGIYARYAQQFLGLRAPLIAKSEYTLKSASISLATDDYFLTDRVEMPEYEPTTTYSSIPIDITSEVVLPAEEAAEEAAAQIFTIRRMRRDLLSGELGEGFYGGGLGAALKELQSEEQRYTDLFMGSTTTQREKRRFTIALTGNTPRYIVCRFSTAAGLSDATDLAAEPILLQITPSGAEKFTPPTTEDVKATYTNYRVADIAKCELLYGSSSLAVSNIPLFEFGYDISCPYVMLKK